MSQNLTAGDFLVFQLESGYALLRVIAIDGIGSDRVWHVAAFDDFFLDVDHAEAAISGGNCPKPSFPHIALTDRAFESTQVAKLLNKGLTDADLAPYQNWLSDPDREVSDRSVRLMMGLR